MWLVLWEYPTMHFTSSSDSSSTREKFGIQSLIVLQSRWRRKRPHGSPCDLRRPIAGHFWIKRSSTASDNRRRRRDRRRVGFGLLSVQMHTSRHHRLGGTWQAHSQSGSLWLSQHEVLEGFAFLPSGIASSGSTSTQTTNCRCIKHSYPWTGNQSLVPYLLDYWQKYSIMVQI